MKDNIESYNKTDVKSKENHSKKSKENKVLKELLSTGLYLLCVFLATWFVITFVGQRTEVDGSSMDPYLKNADQLIVEKVSYRFHDPERFDIIVFPFRYDRKTKYIKRIIGLPGETVRIDLDGNIYINEQLLEEHYGKEVIEPDMVGRAIDPVVLGADEYFVMGDNRNNSSDSRTEIVGNIKREDIIGRAWVRVWPFSEIGSVTKKK